MKQKGDVAELKVAADIRRRGHLIAVPWGEDWLADLIVCRGGELERVQVKHGRSDGQTLVVRARTLTVTAGRVRRVRKYTAADIDWLAVWDSTTDTCAYIPAAELGDGRSELTLRIAPTRNGQVMGIRVFADYLEF